MMGTMKTAPKRKVINKQPHQLSYITPREAKILKMLGGSGRITQEGIPAYDSIFGNTFSGSYVSNPSSISDHFQNAMTDLSTGFGFNSGASDATLNTYADRTANNPNNKINDDGTFNGITTNYSGGNNNTAANNTAANNTAGADAAAEDAARQAELDRLIAEAQTYNTTVDDFNQTFSNAASGLDDFSSAIGDADIYSLYDDPTTAANENIYDNFYDDVSGTYDALTGAGLDAPDLSTDFDFTDEEKALFALSNPDDFGDLSDTYGGLVNTLDTLKTDRDTAVSGLTNTSNELYNTLDDARFGLTDFVNPDGTYDYRGFDEAKSAYEIIKDLNQTTRTIDDELASQTGAFDDVTTLLGELTPTLSGISDAYGTEVSRVNDYGSDLYDTIDALGLDSASISSGDLGNIKAQIDAAQKSAGRFSSDLGFDFGGQLNELNEAEAAINNLIAGRAAENQRVSAAQTGIDNRIYDFGLDAGDLDISNLSQIQNLQRELNRLEREASQFSSPLGGISANVSGVRGTLDDLLAKRAEEESRINQFAGQLGTREDELRAILDNGLTIADLEDMEDLRRRIDTNQLDASRFSSLLDTSDAFRFPLADLGTLEGDVDRLFQDRSDELDRISQAEEDFGRIAANVERGAGSANRFSKAALDAIQDQITSGQRDISEFSSLLPYNFGAEGMDATAIQDFIDAQTALDSAVSARGAELDTISGDLGAAVRDLDTTELYDEESFDQMLDDLSAAGVDLSAYSGGRANDLLTQLSKGRSSVNERLDDLYDRRDQFETDASSMLENLLASDYGRSNYEEYEGLVDTLSSDIDLYKASQADDERKALSRELARRLGLVEADERAVQSRLASEGADTGFNDYALFEPDEEAGFYNFEDEEEEEEDQLFSSFLQNTGAA